MIYRAVQKTMWLAFTCVYTSSISTCTVYTYTILDSVHVEKGNSLTSPPSPSLINALCAHVYLAVTLKLSAWKMAFHSYGQPSEF